LGSAKRRIFGAEECVRKEMDTLLGVVEPSFGDWVGFMGGSASVSLHLQFI
jgi:hypothetical protein